MKINFGQDDLHSHHGIDTDGSRMSKKRMPMHRHIAVQCRFPACLWFVVVAVGGCGALFTE